MANLIREVSILKKELKRIGDAHTCSSAVIIRDGKILLGLRHYTPDKWRTISVWTTPGGRCETGETLEEGLRRETREETGIDDLKIERFIGKVEGAAENGDVLSTFVCSTAMEPKLMEPAKFSEWKWFPTNKIPANFINPRLLALLFAEELCAPEKGS